VGAGPESETQAAVEPELILEPPVRAPAEAQVANDEEPDQTAAIDSQDADREAVDAERPPVAP
jgi:hypothetical protein